MLSTTAELGIWTVTVTSGTNKAITMFFVTTVKTDEMAEQMILIAENSGKIARETITSLKVWCNSSSFCSGEHG